MLNACVTSIKHALRHGQSHWDNQHIISGAGKRGLYAVALETMMMLFGTINF
jgi:hypothetical protein